MPLIPAVVLVLGLIGHFLVAIGYVNRLHALRIRPPWFKILEAPVALATVAAPLVALRSILTSGLNDWWPATGGQDGWTVVVAYYFAAMATILILGVPFWLRHRLRRWPAALLVDQGHRIDVARRLGFRPTGDFVTRQWARVPGNQIFQLDVREKQLGLARLPAALDGFTITHLSDLHLSGRVGVEFHEQVVDEANALQGDVIAVTGDLFDRAACLDWIPRTLARLRAPQGIYFVLGNHDWRLADPGAVRRRLETLGWIDLGGRTRQVRWRDAVVQLAGNECPWFGPAPSWELASGARDAAADAFRVALVHTPDQVGWARRHAVDLVLAGHTHGGQIRLPLIGALVVPSLYGVKYAGGVFHEEHTVLHVSRGVSGLEPVRWHCPPEITRLTLRPAARPESCPRERARRP